MTTPPRPAAPVLMIATITLAQSTWAGRLPNVQPGQAFWCRTDDAAGLSAAGYATYAPPGYTPVPPPEPPHTVHGSPGFGAGTSNSSH